MEYAQAENLVWREDTSNTSDIYLRNALRNQVVPKWKTFEPNLMSNFGDTLSYIKQSQEALDVVVNQWKGQHFIHKGAHIHIDLKALKKLTPQEYYLHALFSTYGFHLNDLKDLGFANSIPSNTATILLKLQVILLFELQFDLHIDPLLHTWRGPIKCNSFMILIFVTGKGKITWIIVI